MIQQELSITPLHSYYKTSHFHPKQSLHVAPYESGGGHSDQSLSHCILHLILPTLSHLTDPISRETPPEKEYNEPDPV